MSESSPTSHALNWQKVTPDNPEYSPEERKLFEAVVGRALGSAEFFQLQVNELGLNLSEDTVQILFLLLAEVVFDLCAVSGISIDQMPSIVPTTMLNDDQTAAYFRQAETNTHALLINSKIVGEAAQVLEQAMSAKDQTLEFKTDALAKAVYAIAHELAHVRQFAKLPYMQKNSQEHWKIGWERTAENLLNYHTDPTEGNAHAVAIRYLTTKKRVRPHSPIWRALDFSQVIGLTLEKQSSHQRLADIFKAQDIVKQRDHAVSKDEYDALQKKAELLLRKIVTAPARLDKAHAFIGSVPPTQLEKKDSKIS